MIKGFSLFTGRTILSGHGDELLGLVRADVRQLL
jgi:hypothetical protein